MFGGGTWEDGSCEEKECRLCRETGISSERGLEVEGEADEKISTSSCVFGTLALEDAVKVRASIAQREAGGMGRQCGSVE